eukprot:TRINITY_DN145_c0_g3_i1.p1 TRINITY_DN145_c0_g3~~TRINITY_DN145_c0_g3_i1.p1  ORF type:complete len:1851 (+),score=714.58 TRINITY_DN145_c0_g3_i1:176-5728(+)
MAGVGWHDPLEPSPPPSEMMVLPPVETSDPPMSASLEMRPAESCASNLDDVELPSCDEEQPEPEPEPEPASAERLLEARHARNRPGRRSLRAGVTPATKSVSMGSFVDGAVSGQRTVSPKALRREEWGKALRRDVELKGLDTKNANEVLNKGVKTSHAHLGELLHADRALGPILSRYLLQPQVLLLLAVLVGLLAAALEGPPTLHGRGALVFDAVMTCVVVAVFATQDVVVIVRRSRDLYQKLTHIVESNVYRFEGHMEGLAGLRGVASCRVVSVLRNSGEDVKVRLTMQDAPLMLGEAWKPSQHSLPGHVRAHGELATKLIESLRVPTEESHAVRVSLEVQMQDIEYRPSVVHVVVATRNQRVKIKCTIKDSLDKAIGDELRPDEWYRVSGKADVVTTGQQWPAGSFIVYVPTPGKPTFTIKVRNVCVSHTMWRWTSFPEALTVQDCDVAMDTGMMRIFKVKRDLLASCLYNAFCMEKDETRGTAPEFMRIGNLGPTQAGMSSPAMLDGVVVQSQCLEGTSPAPVPAAHVFSPAGHSHTPATDHTSTPERNSEVTESPFLSPKDGGASAPRSTETRRGHARTDSAGCPVEGVVHDLLSDDQSFQAPPPPLGDSDSSSSSSSDSEGSAGDGARKTVPSASQSSSHIFPTCAQHRFFLVQRLASIFVFLLAFVLIAVNVVLGTGTVYDRFIHPLIGVALACLPVNAALVLRIVDCYANACLRSMIQMQDTSLKIVAAGGRVRDDFMAGDEEFSSASSFHSEDGSEVGGGDIFGAREDGQLVFGAYYENLSGMTPPPQGDGNPSGFDLTTLAHPSITRSMIYSHMKAILFDEAFTIPAPPPELGGSTNAPVADPFGKPRQHGLVDSCSGNVDLVSSRNVCQVLGSITVLACVDKTGVLSEVVPVPEKVLVMKRKDTGGDKGPSKEGTRREDGSSRASDASVVMSDTGDDGAGLDVLDMCVESPSRSEAGAANFAQQEYHEMAFLTLNVCSDSSAENLLQFADPEWAKYLPQLKPLGLTASLHCLQSLEEEVRGNVNQSANHPHKKQHKGRQKRKAETNQQSHHMREQLHFDDTILWGKYLYFLGKEIGFSEGLLRASGYKVKKRIHTLRPRERTYRTAGEGLQYSNAANYDQTLDARQQMASLVVIDGNGKWQLLSIGAPQFILQYTSDYWNGDDVVPLTATDRKELFYTSNEWRRQRDLTTIAFSYKPLPERYKEFLKADCTGDAIHILEGADKVRRAPRRDGTGTLDPLPDGDSDQDETDNSFLGLDDEDTPFKEMTTEQVYQRLQQKQIFIGMVGSREPPKETVQSSITAFKDAGIRFIHFNPGNERMTKAFGEKLGLWTTANDWNCCISLARDKNTEGMEFAAVKARLPMGIRQIRDHLVHTDNVPLLVPLFCESKPKAVTKMVRTLQEYDEVVGVFGSTFNHTNTAVFRQADLGIAVAPTCNTKLMHENRALTASHFSLFGVPGCPIGKEVADSQKIHRSFDITRKNLFSLGAFVSLPCAVRLAPTEFPLYFILCLIKHARLQQHCILKVVELVISCSVCWGLLAWVCGIVAAPQVLSVTNLLYQLFVFIPLLAVALYEPFESLLCARIMKMHPSKNSREEHMKVMKHLIALWCQRFLLTTVVIGIVYAWTLCYYLDVGVGSVMFVGDALREREDFRPGVEYAQHVAMFSAAVFFASHCIGSLSRHLPVKILTMNKSGITEDGSLTRCRVVIARYRKKTGGDHFNPFEFPRCLSILTFAVLSQALYSFLCLMFVPANGRVRIGAHPDWLYLLVFGYAVLIIALDDVTKPRRRERYRKRQLIRSLHFDTRLGMHSPRGDDKGDEDKGALKEAKKQEDTYWDIGKFYSL